MFQRGGYGAAVPNFLPVWTMSPPGWRQLQQPVQMLCSTGLMARPECCSEDLHAAVVQWAERMCKCMEHRLVELSLSTVGVLAACASGQGNRDAEGAPQGVGEG